MKTLIAVLLAVFAVKAWEQATRNALSGSPAEIASNLPKLFARGAYLETCLASLSVRSSISSLLDDLARKGVSREAVAPWSSLVGGDGNRMRYERELNVFGFYLGPTAIPNAV